MFFFWIEINMKYVFKFLDYFKFILVVEEKIYLVNGMLMVNFDSLFCGWVMEECGRGVKVVDVEG